MLGCIICIPLNKIIYQATQVCINILAKYGIHRSTVEDFKRKKKNLHYSNLSQF
jgi:hypothetical protein